MILVNLRIFGEKSSTMKLYVQVLAIVLCSCLIQDVLSVVQSQKKSTVPRRVASKREVIPKITEYKFLDEVKRMYWSTWEEINMNKFGKMGTRAVRNTMKNILSNEEFWPILKLWVSKQTKTTTNKNRADARVNFCNTLTEVLTNPVMTDQFGPLADSVYEAVIQIKSVELEQGLQVAIDIVTGDKILQNMDMVLSMVARTDLKPEILTKYFKKFKSSVNLGSKVGSSDSVTNNLLKFGATLKESSEILENADNSDPAKIQKSSSARYK